MIGCGHFLPLYFSKHGFGAILSQSKKKLKELEEKLDEIKQKKLHLSSELSRVQVGREESEERSGLLTALGERQAQRIKLAKELEQYKSCDPQTLRELREYMVSHCELVTRFGVCTGEGTTVAKEAANRWTGKQHLSSHVAINIVFVQRTYLLSSPGPKTSSVWKKESLINNLEFRMTLTISNSHITVHL